MLTLLLPETERIYALELPEIYSAYRLYVNDTLVAQMGDPDEETYTPRTKIETVTFQASGRVTLLLAVRDASHYYSGLVYPPAFGLPGGVTLLRGLSLSLQVSALILSLVCAAMAFFAGYRLQRQDAKLRRSNQHIAAAPPVHTASDPSLVRHGELLWPLHHSLCGAVAE